MTKFNDSNNTELSGLQFAAKSCIWFQNQMNTQVRFQTKIALHSVQLPLNYIHLEIAQFNHSKTYRILVSTNTLLKNLTHNCFLCLSFFPQFHNLFTFKQALKSDWLLCFSVPSLAREKLRFRAENTAICELITLLRANQIARITSYF